MAKALEIEKLKLQIARLRRQQFGRSSEKIAREIEQLELRLEELEAEERRRTRGAGRIRLRRCRADHRRQQERRSPARRPLPEHLPRREVVHEPSCTCPTCGGEMRKVGEDVTEILDYIPGRFEVIRHVRPAFSCRQLREHGASADAVAADRARPAGRRTPGPCPGRQVLRSPAALSPVRHLCPRRRRSRPRHAGRLGRQDGSAGLAPWSRPSRSTSWRPRSCMPTTRRCRFWRRAPARPRPDGYGSICATSGPMAGRRRRRSSTATRPIARASIRARIWPDSAVNRPTGPLA